MTDKPDPDPKPNLVPVSFDDVQYTLSFALRYDRRKRFQHADDLMARITAEHLVKHMQLSGMVVFRPRIRQDGAEETIQARQEE